MEAPLHRSYKGQEIGGKPPYLKVKLIHNIFVGFSFTFICPIWVNVYLAYMHVVKTACAYTYVFDSGLQLLFQCLN